MSHAYEPPVFTAPIDLDLSRNEGTPRVDAVDLSGPELASLTSRYPDTSRLRSLIAERHRVPESQVVVTAGGDDALFRCFLATAGGTVVTTTPSFEMIRRYAGQVGSTLLEVPWWDGDFPVDDFLEDAVTHPEMAVIVSPNNPTGSIIGLSDLRKVAESFPVLVLDAAYADFADEDLTDAALEMGNVAVVRTLSKAFGLAGLRVGYLIGPEDLVAGVAGYGSPYSVSALSAELAGRVLERRAGQDVRHEVAGRRARLTGLLEELGAAPLRSQANFVLATDVPSDWLVAAAASLGIGLRQFPDRPDLARCVRITVPGDDSSYLRLEETLRSALAPEALLFDLDGVLVDVGESYRAAIVATAAGYGVEVTAEDIAAAKAAGNASDDWDLTRGLLARAGVGVSFDEVRERFEVIYQGHDETPGLKDRERLLVDPELLRSWAALVPLGVVTARPRRDAEAVLRRFDIRETMTTVVAREDAPSKPDPAPVRLALERLGVSRAWMLGDTPDDLVAARAAGVVPIGVVATGYDPASLRGAARVVGSVDDLQEVLDVTFR